METSVLVAFLGKLHPALVHFPIACVVLAVLAEGVSFIRESRTEGRGTSGKSGGFNHYTLPLLLFGSLSGTVAAAVGYLNRTDQQFFGAAASLVQQHQLFSLLALAALIASAVVFLRAKNHHSDRPARILLLGRISLVLAFSLTLYGAHQGALLVHGSDYFVEVFQRGTVRASLRIVPEFSKEQLNSMPAAASREVSFEEDIQPIFEKRCARCHLDGKRKGDFRMDTRELLLQGGEVGASVIPGDSRDSYLVHLVSGLDQEKVMPEKGKLLTEEEIGLVRGWIDQGLPWDGDPGSLGESEEREPSANSGLLLRVVRPPVCKGCALKSHPIDKFLLAYWREKEMAPPKLVSDERYIRRLYTDLLGRIPTMEEAVSAQELLTEKGSEALVNVLLSRSEEYAGAWLGFWNDLLRNDYTGPGYNSKNPLRKRKEITGWLKRALEKNMPYDVMVRTLIAPHKRAEGFIKGILWPGVINPNERPEMQAAQNVGQVFLGINLKCASCHDSFTSKWTLEDSYALASVFSEEPLKVFECDQETSALAHARFLYSEVDEIREESPREERLEQLADSLTKDENGRFSRTLVNRMWAKLFGRGFQEPLDETKSAGWNQKLQEWLAAQFVQSGYDLRALLKRIVMSEAYRLESVPGTEGLFDDAAPYVFRGPIYRPMPAEVVMDSLYAVFGTLGPLSTSDLRRLSKGQDEKPLRIRLDPDKQKEITLPVSKSDEIVMHVRIPIKRKRKMKDYPESELSISGEGLSDLVVEHYRLDKPDRQFVTQEAGNRLITSGVGEIRLAGRDLSGKVLSVQQKKNAPVEITFYSDLESYSSLREHTPVLAALGRPKRVQVTSRRDSLFSSPRILELSTNTHWDSMLRFAAKRLEESRRPLELLSHLLGRDLTTEEEELFEAEMKSDSTNLLWVVVASPDFLMIG